MKFKLAIILYILLPLQLIAQGVATRSVVDAIPGDNVLRFYRLAIPVTKSAFEEDLNSEYGTVLAFWRECEEYVNKLYIPLGFCFDVIEDEKLVLHEHGMIDENIYNAPSFGTELLNELISSSAYDIGMWVTHRDDYEENSGLSVENGAYLNSTKASGYAKTDKWVVAHEIGHLLGADHTPAGEGSLMDQIGDYLSYLSIKRIRTACMEKNAAYYSDEQRTSLVGSNAGGNYVYGVKVNNSAPSFVAAQMKDTYRIPQGGCLSVGLFATDADGDALRYMAIGDDIEALASLQPQEDNVIDYRPRYSADIYYPEYFYSVQGTDIPMLSPGKYGISLIVYDSPAVCSLEAMKTQPFYCNYAVWDADIEIVSGTEFTASLSPAKDVYTAGENVTVKWSADNGFFTADSRVRITMSANYGETFDYVLAESVPATDGSCAVVLPNVNVGAVDVDFVTAVRSMRGGIIKVEEIGGVAYTLTTLSPENGGGFTVTGGGSIPTPNPEPEPTPVTYTVSITAEPANGGVIAVNGKDTSVTVEEKSQVTLSATANDGYTFDGWYCNGVCVSTVAEYSFAVSANAQYVARFKDVVVEPEEPQVDVLTDGAVYQILNVNYTNPQKYIIDNSNTNAQATTLGTDVASSAWVVSKKSANCYSFKNSSTNRYLTGTTAQSGRWTMSNNESVVYVYKESDGRYYISAVELADLSTRSMSCAHNPGDHNNLVTWYNVDDKGAAILPSMWNIVEYVEPSKEASYTVTDEAGNVYSGTYSGTVGVDRPVFTGVYGYELVNEKWNGSNYEATIVFPFVVSKAGETPNEILISFFNEKSKVWRAVGNDVKVQTNNSTYPVDLNALWSIYPRFKEGNFTFVIKNVANGKYVYSAEADNTNKHNKQGTVVLNGTPSEFEYVHNGGKMGFRFAGMQKLYLSINSVNDNDVYLGVYPSVHNGTKIYDSEVMFYGVAIGDTGYATFYAQVPVAVPDGVTAYYLAENDVHEDWVELTEIKEKEIPAGVGVVLNAQQGVYKFEILDKATVEINSLFKGTVVAENVTEEAFVLYTNDGKAELCRAEMNQTVGEGKEQQKAFLNNGHKAYLPAGSLKQGASNSKSLGLYFPGTTDIENVKTESGKVKAIYDLQGRKVDTTSKGLYIIDGRKVLVK
ncbi:MAG: hypothetical protein IIV04_02860 [Bacteroidaceae bacterium]|nr:hypothetical protein [Bacteroidaceae bacterium]